MAKKLKRKTALRDEVKSRVGNTGWMDNIWVDSNGNWQILSVGTICQGEQKFSFGYTFSQDYGESLDKAITRGIQHIEGELN